MPEDLKDVIRHRHENDSTSEIWISCSGQSTVSEEKMGPIIYMPTRSFPADPQVRVIAIQMERPCTGILIGIKCQIWVANAEASVSFDVMVD